MARYVAFLRAVNVGSRRVAMAQAREVLDRLGYADVSSYVNSGNLTLHRHRSGRGSRSTDPGCVGGRVRHGTDDASCARHGKCERSRATSRSGRSRPGTRTSHC